jgi:hypothetical protein
MNDYTIYEKNWTGISFFNLTPVVLPFYPPSGNLLHGEVFRLLPNYAMPTGENYVSYEILRGGRYPALLKTNVMNVYLNINWSAGCGDSINCI